MSFWETNFIFFVLGHCKFMVTIIYLHVVIWVQLWMKYLVLGCFEALLSNTERAPGSHRENAVTGAGIACLITRMREDPPGCCAGGGKGPTAQERRNTLPLGSVASRLTHPSSSGGTCWKRAQKASASLLFPSTTCQLWEGEKAGHLHWWGYKPRKWRHGVTSLAWLCASSCASTIDAFTPEQASASSRCCLSQACLVPAAPFPLQVGYSFQGCAGLFLSI